MEKTITDLSIDYFKAAADMDSLIKKCTSEIKEETKKGNSKKTYLLKRKRLKKGINAERRGNNRKKGERLCFG